MGTKLRGLIVTLALALALTACGPTEHEIASLTGVTERQRAVCRMRATAQSLPGVPQIPPGSLTRRLERECLVQADRSGPDWPGITDAQVEQCARDAVRAFDLITRQSLTLVSFATVVLDIATECEERARIEAASRAGPRS